MKSKIQTISRIDLKYLLKVGGCTLWTNIISDLIKNENQEILIPQELLILLLSAGIAEQIRVVKSLGVILPLPTTSQEFLNQMWDKCEGILNPVFSSGTYYGYENKYFFEKNMKNKEFHVTYYGLWSILEGYYGYNYEETKKFIQQWVVKRLKLKDYNIFQANRIVFMTVKEYDEVVKLLS